MLATPSSGDTPQRPEKKIIKEYKVKRKVKKIKYKDPRPFSQKHPFWNFILAILVLIGLGTAVFYILKFLGRVFIKSIDWLAQLQSKMDAVVVVALITAAVTIITGIVSKVFDYKQRRNEYLFQKRAEPYAEFINTYSKMQEKAQKHENYSPDEMFEDIQKFQRGLMLWGSNRVVNAWIDYRNNANNENILFYMENILYAIRQDMGYRKLGKGKLLSISINGLLKK